MIKRLKCRITGRVQGVMFRDFTTRKARGLGLVGIVKNIKDGSVEVTSEGDEEKLKQLLVFLNKGSLLSKVNNVESFWLEPTNEFLGFNIVYDNQK